MKLSSGLLLYRLPPGRVEVLLVHMGGPFWARKDEHAWSIPKGEYTEGADPLAVAAREFTEELGAEPPDGPTFELGSARQSAKTVTVFARAGDFDATTAVTGSTVSASCGSAFSTSARIAGISVSGSATSVATTTD